MPVAFDWESCDILRVKYHGLIDGDDAVAASLAMSADPRFDDLIGIIIDTLELTENTAQIEHVEKLVAISKSMVLSNPRIRNALVINYDENTSGLAALYTFLAEELVWEVEMFADLEPAREWVFAVRNH